MAGAIDRYLEEDHVRIDNSASRQAGEGIEQKAYAEFRGALLQRFRSSGQLQHYISGVPVQAIGVPGQSLPLCTPEIAKKSAAAAKTAVSQPHQHGPRTVAFSRPSAQRTSGLCHV